MDNVEYSKVNSAPEWKYKLDWFGMGLVLWHINHCRLLNAKSILYI